MINIDKNQGRIFDTLKNTAFFVKNSLLDFIYPQLCILCNSKVTDGNGWVCTECANSLEFLSGPCTQHERLDIPQNNYLYFDMVMSPYLYENNVKNLIHLYKYSGQIGLSRFLATSIATVVKTVDRNWDYLVPVPLHHRKKRERGFNQSELLAREISKQCGIPVLSDGLKRTCYTASQARKDREHRTSSLDGAFSVIKPERIKEKSVMVLDDVVTTGSTVNECARVLVQNGAKNVDIASIARVEKLNHNR